MSPEQIERLAELRAKKAKDDGETVVFNPWSSAELVDFCDLEATALREEIDAGTKRWGGWRYNPETPPSVDYRNGYSVVLERADDVAKIGDWLLHLQDKQWVTPEVLGQLVNALVDLDRLGLHTISGRGVA